MRLFLKSVEDYFSVKFISLSFFIFLIPLLIFGILLMFGANEFVELFSQALNEDDFSSLSQYPLLLSFLKLSIIKWIFVSIFYSLGVIFAVLFSLFFSMIAISFLTPYIVKNIYYKHYFKQTNLEGMTNLNVYKILAINMLKFLALLLICLPFAWIPFVINLPFFYLFYKLMIIDVASNMMSEEEFKSIKNKNFAKLLLLSFCFFLCSLVPIAGIFLQIFFVIYFSHLFFNEKISFNKITSIPHKIT